MHEYDVAFKLILQQSVDVAIREIAGTTIARWLNVELPEVRNTRVDLLGETEGGDLIHIELQSTNDPTMPLRMAEYGLRVFRLFGKFPRQILVYVGDAPLRMADKLLGPSLEYSYRIVDVRDFNGERLLESPKVGDNTVPILTTLPDRRASIHRVVRRIAGLGPGERETAPMRLLILAGLRRLSGMVEEEARQMPILNDILEHEVIGREYRKGELNLLLRQIEKRSGTIPKPAPERLSGLSIKNLRLWVCACSMPPALRRCSARRRWASR
jgi:hypothetical protein